MPVLNHCRMPIVGAACGSTSAKLRGVIGARNPIPPMEVFGASAACAAAATASMSAVASIIRFKGFLLLKGAARVIGPHAAELGRVLASQESHQPPRAGAAGPRLAHRGHGVAGARHAATSTYVRGETTAAVRGRSRSATVK